MKSLRSIVLVLVLFSVQIVFGGHSGEIDDYKTLTNEKQRELQSVINEWALHSCTCGVHSSKTVYTYGNPRTGSRIDLQGFDSRIRGSSSMFHRYAVQQGSGTYAVVHIETGERFGVGLIRGSFDQSRNARAHVFLARENVPVNLPNDGKQYVSGLIKRKIDGEINKTVVWSTRDVVDALVQKFNRPNLN